MQTLESCDHNWLTTPYGRKCDLCGTKSVIFKSIEGWEIGANAPTLDEAYDMAMKELTRKRKEYYGT